MGAAVGALPITEENRQLLRSGYSSRKARGALRNALMHPHTSEPLRRALFFYSDLERAAYDRVPFCDATTQVSVLC